MPPWLLFALLGGAIAAVVVALDEQGHPADFDWDAFIASHTELHA